MRAFRACVEVARESSKGSIGPKIAPSETDQPDWVSAQCRVKGRLGRELEDTVDRAGIDVLFGGGSLFYANTIRVEGNSEEPEILHADYIVLATGSRPDFVGHTWVLGSNGAEK